MARNPNYLRMENKMTTYHEIKGEETPDLDREKILKTMIQKINEIKPLTVGDLRQVIEGLPDSVQILTAQTPEGAYSEWFNLSHEIGVPDLTRDDSEYSALTFFPVDSYDSRQF